MNGAECLPTLPRWGTVAIADVSLGSGRGTLATYLGDWVLLGYALLLASVWLRERTRATQAANGSRSAQKNESASSP
ncbi:MAG: hypothetical protein KatS3mg016_0623 [Fimbriimonadales bacterium]|nr:MAG: hypothetical protein KatS3mg016_0623 [Fimbriimonadales bacterium]